MRLIDADKLIEEFSGMGNFDAVEVRSRITYAPTAYDINGVVEQLGDYGNEEMGYCRNTPYEKCIEECVHKAIDIVKSGVEK